MNPSVEAQAAGLDKVKLAAAALLLVGGLFAFYYFAAYSTLVRVLGLLAVGGVAAWVGLQTAPGRQLWQFVVDARMEVRKVVWPSRQETLQTTLVVAAMVLALALVLWLFDLVLVNILKLLTGHGG